MKIIRLSTLSPAISLVLLAAVFLPAENMLAHHCKGGHENLPGCDAGGDSGKPQELHDLSFEPLNGPDSHGLLTVHKNLAGGFDYSGRSSVGCPSSAPGIDEWDITFEKNRESGVLIYTADGPDLIIDLLASPLFDGCLGATLDDNGLFKLELRKTGKGRITSCEAKLFWRFGHTSSNDHLSMLSEDWIALTPPFDQCTKTSQETSVLINGNFNFFETTAAGGTIQIGGPLALAFFVVFHAPGD